MPKNHVKYSETYYEIYKLLKEQEQELKEKNKQEIESRKRFFSEIQK